MGSLLPPSSVRGWLLRAYRVNRILVEDQVLLAVQLDLVAAILGEDDDVALADAHRAALAVLQQVAGAHGDDGALLRLLPRRVRKDDPSRRALFRRGGLDDHLIAQRTDPHRKALPPVNS